MWSYHFLRGLLIVISENFDATSLPSKFKLIGSSGRAGGNENVLCHNWASPGLVVYVNSAAGNFGFTGGELASHGWILSLGFYGHNRELSRQAFHVPPLICAVGNDSKSYVN